MGTGFFLVSPSSRDWIKAWVAWESFTKFVLLFSADTLEVKQEEAWGANFLAAAVFDNDVEQIAFVLLVADDTTLCWADVSISVVAGVFVSVPVFFDVLVVVVVIAVLPSLVILLLKWYDLKGKNLHWKWSHYVSLNLTENAKTEFL